MKRDRCGVRVGTSATALRALTIVLTLSWGASAAAAETDQRPAPRRANIVAAGDRPALQKLHDANLVAIQVGQLAQDKGSSRAVKDFGRQLIADHTRAERMIGDYLRRHGLNVNTFTTTTDPDPAHEVLAAKWGAAFDRAFVAQVAADHQKAIDLIETARNDTADDELMTLFDQLMTTERAHKRAALMLPVSRAGA